MESYLDTVYNHYVNARTFREKTIIVTMFVASAPIVFPILSLAEALHVLVRDYPAIQDEDFKTITSKTLLY